MNKRIFVEKRENYRQESNQLLQHINNNTSLNLTSIRLLNIYDIYNIDLETFQKSCQTIFSEIMVDELFEQLELTTNHYFAYEFLPAQFDQRGDSAMQCIRLINPNSKAFVRSGTLILFERALSESELNQIEKLIVNPIESQRKNMEKLDFSIAANVKPLKDLTGFNLKNDEQLQQLKEELSLALSLEDLKFIQAYFRSENRDPSETELFVLDCYWSDHCRHTTFETILEDITFNSALFNNELQTAFNQYLEMRKSLNITKEMTLMDMASVVGKYHKIVLQDENIEVSEEINACSFFTTIENNGQKERWLIQFKNETHNHPTEIEPFGGASTCIGGAIRDPLSGRSYVYQAMRISGSGNILQPRNETLAYKLPQIDISKVSAHGNSSYGNQIGLATTFVRELYDDSYVAKHMEVGAVVGAVKEGNFKRQSPQKDDIVIMIGGRTGRDGIQGASGSSLSHNNQSITTASSQVQKGNAPEERKLQRLFRDPEVSKLIKKCNDFGAGGVCVAIGELSESIEIYLDRVLLKYEGLNATEIAISESQERMAVVIDPNDYDRFTKACQKENIEFVHVANITDKKRLQMFYNDELVVDMGAEFLATSGVRQYAKAEIIDNAAKNPFISKSFDKQQLLTELASLNVTSQKGLAHRFDASIGATTVLMPFSGKYQLTPTQASVQALPTLYSTSDTATILSYGFIPKISHYSPFLSAIYAVLESIAKVYAVGGNTESLYLSFQEYFEKLGNDPKKWGKVTQSLLGSIYAQKSLGVASIGGKDSMSGTFNDLNVVETLISFACTPVKIDSVITPELKTIGNKLYFIPLVKNEAGFPDLEKMLIEYNKLHQAIQDKKVVSAYVLDEASLASSLVKMAVGNHLGFNVEHPELLSFLPGSIVIEAVDSLEFELLGTVADTVSFNGITMNLDELKQAYVSTLNTIYPLYMNEEKGNCENINTSGNTKRFYKEKVASPNVVIPVFPGTNCEYDCAKAFYKSGAGEVQFVVFRNIDEQAINESILELEAAIKKSHIVMLPGGFSSGDEPDGSAKFIVNVLNHPKIKSALHQHLNEQKLVLGICNGFQALIKSGLLPYGEIRQLDENDLTLYRNDSLHHISTTAFTRVSNTTSPWTQFFELGEIHEVIFSHGEGKLVGNILEQYKHLAAFQYCDFNGNATLNGQFNPNGSLLAIEGLISEDGLILGKMGHSERSDESLYITNTLKNMQHIFENGIRYFKGE